MMPRRAPSALRKSSLLPRALFAAHGSASTRASADTAALPPSPGPSLPCTSPSGSATEYCAHDGFYCDGGVRTHAHQGGGALTACKALCDADANCNCVGHSPRHAGENCRACHGASALTASGGGYDAAFVNPDFYIWERQRRESRRPER